MGALVSEAGSNSKALRFLAIFFDGVDLALINKDVIFGNYFPWPTNFEKRRDRHIFDRILINQGFGPQDDQVGKELIEIGLILGSSIFGISSSNLPMRSSPNDIYPPPNLFIIAQGVLGQVGGLDNFIAFA